MAAWAGLGYYSRARNLVACARVLSVDGFPTGEDGLRTLPGVGPYTAAAIAAIAFGQRAVVVDGNVERVVARLFRVETPLPEAKPELRRLAGTITPEARCGDFAQAMMDLGATLCVPRNPRCDMCPLVVATARHSWKATRGTTRAGCPGCQARTDGDDVVDRAGRAGAADAPTGKGIARRHDGAPRDALYAGGG